MKQILTTVFITLTLFSCTKENDASIVGVWRQTSVYSRDNTGNYYWSGAPSLPYILQLNGDGTFSGSQCYSTGHGVYQYDHATRQIKLQDIPSGSIITISVSDLDDDNLILDYGITSMGEYKIKFIRYQY